MLYGSDSRLLQSLEDGVLQGQLCVLWPAVRGAGRQPVWHLPQGRRVRAPPWGPHNFLQEPVSAAEFTIKNMDTGETAAILTTDANGEAIYDSTVSIVNLGTFTETGKITVGQNPGKIKALDSHRFIVACAGDHLSPTTVIVDILSQEKTPLSVSATNFDIYNNTIYLYNTSYDAQWNPTASFYRVDATTLQVTPMLESYSRKLSYAYGINVDPATGNLYVCNSPYTANADIYTFRPDGTELRHVEGGILSSKVVF